METTLTFRQQLIMMMAENIVSKSGISQLTDSTISLIKDISKQLSEGTQEVPISKATIPLDANLYDYGLRINPLSYNDIITVGDLINYTPYELLRLRNFGKAALRQVEAFLGRHGLKLNGV